MPSQKLTPTFCMEDMPDTREPAPLPEDLGQDAAAGGHGQLQRRGHRQGAGRRWKVRLHHGEPPAAVQAGQELPAQKGGRPVLEAELWYRGGAGVALQGAPQQRDPEDAGVRRHGGDH